VPNLTAQNELKMKLLLILGTASSDRPLQLMPIVPPSTDLILNCRILGGMVAVLWVLELVDSLLLGGALNRFGIRPRKVAGLKGIVWSPLLHGDLAHLAANTLPLVIMGGLILFRSQMTFAIVTGVVWLISGVGTWLCGGARTNHIGASGIVFGYLGFLLMQGYVERSPIAIGLAVIAGTLYGSSLWGVLPLKRGKSWECHLFGAIGGVVAARYLPELTAGLRQLLSQSS
jgi:membrane associated rhomboid family serine protease